MTYTIFIINFNYPINKLFSHIIINNICVFTIHISCYFQQKIFLNFHIFNFNYKFCNFIIG